MSGVAEQRGDDRHNSQDEPGADVQPSSPAEPPAQKPIDEEQLRQFQQFQQFQDYLKFSEAQRQSGGTLVPQQPQPPVPQQARQPATTSGSQDLVPTPPPKIKAPRWLKRLGGKILGWIIVLVVIGLALNWGYHRLFPSTANDNRPAAETGGGKYHTNHVYSKLPYEAVRIVYQNVANGQVLDACGRFDEPVQQKFATDLGFADCQQAILGLHKQVQVTAKNAYAESIPSSISEPIPGNTFVISSCRFGIKGGPALGAFQVTKVEDGQWLITGHSTEPDPCPAPSPTTSPTP
jgi:hypothetical protein